MGEEFQGIDRYSPSFYESKVKPVKHSLQGWQIEVYNVAKYYGISPHEILYEWNNIEFLDAQEYMFLQQYYEQEESKNID